MTTIPAGSPHYRAAIEDRFAGDARFTEATLAVAYEMRTANLIALMDHTDRHNAPMATETYIAIQQEIAERLDHIY